MIYSGSIIRFKLIRRLVLLVIPPLLVKTSISRNATLIKLRSLVFTNYSSFQDRSSQPLSPSSEDNFYFIFYSTK